MIKRIVNAAIKTLLNEVFLDTSQEALRIDLLGRDLFSDSSIRLKDMQIRPDIFDICLSPLKLVSGHIGSVMIEGIAEAYMGGVVRINLERVYFLFTVDTTANAEKVQLMKKILVELRSSSSISDTIIKELMKRIQGLPPDKDPDTCKRREMALRALDYAFKNVQVSVRNIHLRIESYDKELSSPEKNPPPPGQLPTHHLCCSLGVTIPTFQINKQTPGKREGVGCDELSTSWSIKSLQVYCDYGCESYVEDPQTPCPSRILAEFTSRWKSEVHTAMVLPFDIYVSIATEVHKKSGLLLPKIKIMIPNTKIAIDPNQLIVLKDVIEDLAIALKRAQSLTRLPIYSTSKRALPMLKEAGGIHILPHMSFHLHGDMVVKNYPTDCNLNSFHLQRKKGDSASSLICFLRLTGVGWAKRLWKHVIRLVLHDLQSMKPLGRWIQLMQLLYIRKEYAYMYSRYLRKSKSTGKILFFAGARVHYSISAKLYEYEMLLPISVVVAFRQMAVIVMVDELVKNKVRSLRSKANSEALGCRISMRWRDLLVVNSELLEMQHGIGRCSYSDNDDDDDDDTSSIAASEDLPPKVRPSTPGSVAGANPGGIFSRLGHSIGLKGKEAISSSSFSPSISSSDNIDSQLLKKGESSVLSDFMHWFDTSPETIEEPRPVRDLNPSPVPFTDSPHTLLGKGIWTTLPKLEGDVPSIGNIVDAIDWVILRYRSPIRIVPPNLSIEVSEFELNLRMPIEKNTRKTILSLFYSKCACIVTISSLNMKQHEQSKREQGVISTSLFAPLKGSLIQISSTVKSMSACVHIHPQVQELGPMDTLVMTYESLNNNSIPPLPPRLEPLISAVMKYYSMVDKSKAIAQHVEHAVQKYKGHEKILIERLVAKYHVPFPAYAEEEEEEEEGAYSTSSLIDVYREQVKFTSAHEQTSKGSLNSDKATGEVVKIINSTGSSDFMVACVILDYYGGKGQGAIDIQLQFGPTHAYISGLALTPVADPLIYEYALGAYRAFEDVSSVMSIVYDPALVMDRETGVPVVQNLCSAGSSAANLHDAQDRLKGYLQSGVLTRENRADIAANKNYEEWYSMLKNMMPEELCVSVQISEITADLLSERTIRDFIRARVQAIADKAIRGNSSSSMIPKSALVKVLRDLRAWGSLNSSTASDSTGDSRTAKCVIPTTSFEFVKSITPYSKVDIKAFGIYLNVPMSDDTLCHILAMGFGTILPIY